VRTSLFLHNIHSSDHFASAIPLFSLPLTRYQSSGTFLTSVETFTSGLVNKGPGSQSTMELGYTSVPFFKTKPDKLILLAMYSQLPPNNPVPISSVPLLSATLKLMLQFGKTSQPPSLIHFIPTPPPLSINHLPLSSYRLSPSPQSHGFCETTNFCRFSQISPVVKD